MSLFGSASRRIAAMALAALLASSWTAAAQEKPDSEKVAAKAKAMRGKIQEALAADPVGSRFRIDEFGVDKGTVVIKGVVLAPGKTAAEKKASEEAAIKKVEAAIQQVTDEKDFKDFSTEAVRIAEKETHDLPNFLVQTEAVKVGGPADELKIDTARFDKNGNLVLVGSRGKSPETAMWLAAATKKLLAAHPAALPPGKKELTDDLVKAAVGGVEPRDWPISPNLVQAELHKAKLRRYRVDRVACSAEHGSTTDNPNGMAWTFTVSGITLGSSAADSKPIEAVVSRSLDALGASKSATLTINLTTDDYRIPDPAIALQKAIAEIPTLDGLRVDPGSHFGADGEVLLAGLHPGLSPDATKVLTETYKKVLGELKNKEENPLRATAYGKLIAMPVSAANMIPVDTRKLLGDLRQWVTDNKDDVRLTRLYFDGDRGLKLVCAAPDEKDYLAVRDVLRKLAADYPALAEKPKTPSSDSPPKTDPPKTDPKEEKKEPQARGSESPFAASAVVVQPKVEMPTIPMPDVAKEDPDRPFPALTPYLRDLMTRDPKTWGGVLIERGKFDKDNKFTILGVVDDGKQNKALAALFEKLKGDPTWATYFAVPANVPDLTIMPIAEMVDRIQRVMPAYPAFDGIRVSNAAYDKNANLVFGAHVVGRPDRTAEVLLKELIAADKEGYGRRLPKDRAVKFVSDAAAIPPNDQLADFSIGYGALALVRGDMEKAKQWIEVGMLHYPGEAGIWYLSAYYNHLLGDKELARRDLYRMIEVEGRLDFDGPNPRKRRYAAAKDLQGEKRDELEKLWLECWKEVRDGAKPMTIAKPK